MYSEQTLRRKAKEINLYVHKGYRHYIHTGTVIKDDYGKPFVGYGITDLRIGFDVCGSNDNNFDHLLTLEEVEQCLRDRYEELGLSF